MQTTDRHNINHNNISIDHIDLLIIQRLIDDAFQSLLQVVQPGRPNRSIPEHRLHSIISYLIEHVSKPDHAHVLCLICQNFAHWSPSLTLLESVNILSALEKCLEFPSLVINGLETLLSLVHLFNPNIIYVFDRIRKVLYPFCQSSDPATQRLAIENIARIIGLSPVKGMQFNAHGELILLLSQIPRIIKRESLQNLSTSLQCLLTIIPFATSSVQASSTSIVLILRKSLILTEKFLLDLSGKKANSDGTTLLISIRFTALACVKKIAHMIPSLVNGFWSSFLPISAASAVDRHPFGGPTLVTFMLFDPAAKIRIASSEALVAMIEGAPFHTDFVNCSSSKGASCLNPRIQEIVDALHFACLHSLSSHRPEFAVLKVISSLATRLSYSSLAHSREYLSQIFAKLLAILPHCHSSIKHDLFTCLASTASAPVVYDDAVIDFAVSTLLKECQSDNNRSPPNSLTVIGRISRRRPLALSQHWYQIRLKLLDALRHRNEHVRLSALTLIEEWLSTTEGVINTFLTFEGGEELLQIIVEDAKSASLHLKSKCLITLSRISRHSWTNEITESLRLQLCDLIRFYCCNVDFSSFAERLQSAFFRFIGALGSYSVDSSIIQYILPHILRYSCHKKTISARNRAAQALSDILDCLNIPSKCTDFWAVVLLLLICKLPGADILFCESKHVLHIVKEYLESQNIPIIINALRICASVFTLDAFRELAHLVIPNLLLLLSDHPLNVKIQWNVCRAFGSFIATDHFDYPDVIEALLELCRSSNKKVASSAFSALNHPALYKHNPAFKERLSDVINSCTNSDVKKVLFQVSTDLEEASGPGTFDITDILSKERHMSSLHDYQDFR